MNNKNVAIYTLGCKVNAYDTEVLKELFEQKGYNIVDFNDRADIYIVNTCTVTHFGDKKSRQILRRAKRRNPQALVVATGCYAQVSPDELSDIEEIDLVVGARDRNHLIDLIENFSPEQKIFVSDYEDREDFQDFGISENSGHTRAYVKVEDGCRQFCSYCIVPYARGPIRSRTIEDTIKEIEKLVSNGYQEIVLSGIHIASYGKKEGSSLIELIGAVSQVKGLKRIRLSSLEPGAITSDFLERISQIETFCPHFHLSLQSGSDTVLKRMNRRYTTDQYLKTVENIRKFFPDAGITTDIIVGFPGETNKEFNETLEFVKKVGFSKIHIFPYSPRAGTPAAEMKDQVDSETKHKRVEKLTEIEKALRKNFYQNQLSKTAEVLIEKQLNNNIYTGYTENYIPVNLESEDDIRNTIVFTELTGLDDNGMKAKLKERRQDE